MDFVARLVLFATCLLFGVEWVHSQGPVFINSQNAASVASETASANQGNYVTQTVYGFLDFTTTIGNTVMVFSPQSAAPSNPPETKTVSNEIISNNVIETKPIATKKEVDIKPSKTQVTQDKKSSSEKVFSVVQVQSNAPETITSKVEIKHSSVSKMEEKLYTKEVAPRAPVILSSKVEVVDGGIAASNSKLTSTQNIVTKVEIVGGSPKSVEPIIASKVEVHTEPESTVLSSIVQVKSDNEPAAVIGNNIGDPEYDFLSRQPSEVVEETFKVIDLKSSSKFLLKHRPATHAKKNGATKRGEGSYPTGLVTKLGGTVVKDGVTTVIETSVIGTYISGKYAQVLQSNTKKIQPTQSLRILKTAAPSLSKGNKQRHIDPSPAANANEETAASPVENVIKSSPRKPTGTGTSFKRFKNRHKESESAAVAEEDNEHQDSGPNYKKSQKNRSQSQPAVRNPKHDTKPTTHNRPQQKFRGSRNRKQPTTPKPSVHSEEPPTSATGKRYSPRRTNKSTKPPPESSAGFSRRGYKPKVQPSTVDANGGSSSSLYKFKLNRSPGRWQYKTTSKPRVTIRKQNNDETANNNEAQGTASSPMPPAAAVSTQDGGPQPPPINDAAAPQARSDDVDSLEGSESIASIIDDESATANKLEANAEKAPPAFPVETIKVEISAPSDFGDVYYEIATIKTPYTFQVGSVKNTRYVTVTSTFEKSLEHSSDPVIKATEPLTENILATSSNYAKDNNFLDSSIATLPPLYLASDMETPPLETLTETFSTMQTMLKTHILPIIRNGNDTTSSTLVQTYLITRLVTATKTLPPMEAYHFIPSKTLNEFNSHLDEAGSELHLELEFGDQNDQEDSVRKVSLPADLDLANIGSKFDLSDVDKTKLEGHLRPKKNQSPTKPGLNDLPSQQMSGLSPDQLQQLALYRLLNPGAVGQGQVITTSKPVIKVETLYETFILPVTQGHNTIQSTISKLKGTITKTEYEFGTSTIAPAFPQINPLQQQLNPLQPQINPLQPLQPQLNPFLPPQAQFAVTSSPVVQTTLVTQTNSKILKLTFGAKTAHTTIYSTTLIPTVTTSYVTASVQVPGAGGYPGGAGGYPGYYPAPFPAYPYVG